MRISIVGAGHVGVVTAACLAELGHDVVCVDVDASKVSSLSAGKTPIYEPGLAELVARNAGGRLQATTDVAAAVSGTDLTLIAVGTPSVNGRIDLGAVASASRAIGQAFAAKHDYHVVVVKSTVVPGTTDGMVLPLLEEGSGKTAGVDFGVGVNPEFLTEGQAVADFMAPDRLLLGGIDERTHSALEDLYASFPASVPRLLTNTRTAEATKCAANALLATMISFANEVGNLCAAIEDVDVVEVMRGLHLSQYLSPSAPDGTRVRAPIASYLEAGCGFGGSCLPKDTQAIIGLGEELGQEMRVLRAVEAVNRAQPAIVVDLVDRALGGLEGSRVAVLGLAFKPGTDDVRESPAFPIIRLLVARGASVVGHDPVAVGPARSALDGTDVAYEQDLEAALEGADALVVVTRWPEFERLPELVAGLERPPVVVDGRRMLDRTAFPRYAGVGL